MRQVTYYCLLLIQVGVAYAQSNTTAPAAGNDTAAIGKDSKTRYLMNKFSGECLTGGNHRGIYFKKCSTKVPHWEAVPSPYHKGAYLVRDAAGEVCLRGMPDGTSPLPRKLSMGDINNDCMDSTAQWYIRRKDLKKGKETKRSKWYTMYLVVRDVDNPLFHQGRYCLESDGNGEGVFLTQHCSAKHNVAQRWVFVK